MHTRTHSKINLKRKKNKSKEIQTKETPIDIANGIVKAIDQSIPEDDGSGSTTNWKGER